VLSSTWVLAAMALEVLLLSARRVTMKKNFIQSARKTVSVVVFGCALTGIFASLGCNTVQGLGQDIERGGEKTQDAADAVKRRM
jgi:entericidin B